MPSPVAQTCVLPINTNCSSPARLHRRLVHGRFPHRARCTGMLFPRSFVTQPSPSASSDNPWKLIFSTTLIDSVSLLFCTFIGFLQFFFVFKCLVYLLTYLRASVTALITVNNNYRLHSQWCTECKFTWSGKTTQRCSSKDSYRQFCWHLTGSLSLATVSIVAGI